MIIVKLLIIKCVRAVKGYSTIQKANTHKSEILKFIDVITCDLDIVLILLRPILFTYYVK